MPASHTSPDNSRPILLIPDVHQDHDFLSAVLERHPPDSLAEIVLLGDLLDSREEAYLPTDSLVRVLRILREVRDSESCRLTQLLGNHDWDYLSFWPLVQRSVSEGCGSVVLEFSLHELSFRTAAALMETTDPDLPYLPDDEDLLWPLAWWQQARLAVIRSGVLLSHAGLHPLHWPKGPGTDEEKVRRLNDELDRGWARLLEGGTVESDLLRAGGARGGRLPAGGPLWLDWNHEFEDSLPLPQVVAHTPGPRPRQKGRSWCLDCAQRTAALLHPDGTVEPFRIRKTGARQKRERPARA